MFIKYTLPIDLFSSFLTLGISLLVRSHCGKVSFIMTTFLALSIQADQYPLRFLLPRLHLDRLFCQTSIRDLRVAFFFYQSD